MNRTQLYHSLVALGFYLPSLTDKSLTLQKLEALSRYEVLALFESDVEMINFGIRYSKKAIRKTILEIYQEELPLGFSEGRLPNKAYLINYLFTFDPVHPLFGQVIKFQKKRIFKVNEECLKCLRQVESFHNSLPYKCLIAKPVIERPYVQPEGIDMNLDLVSRARRICKSQHKRLIGTPRILRRRQLKA